MFESGYYPPGAEFDPRAPYNEEPSAVDQYGEKVENNMNKEIEEFDDRFADLIVDIYPQSEDTHYSLQEWYYNQPEEVRKEITDKYFDEYFEDDCIAMAEEEAERNDWAREYAMELKHERD